MGVNQNDALYECLFAVLTVQECAKIYNRHPKTVMQAIWTGRIIARQSEAGATWLISRASAAQLWKEKTDVSNNVAGNKKTRT